MDTSGLKCAICYSLAENTNGRTLFVNIESRLAHDGVCDRHRITQDTRIEFIPAWGVAARSRLERTCPGDLVYYSEDREKSNVDNPVPTFLR